MGLAWNEIQRKVDALLQEGKHTNVEIARMVGTVESTVTKVDKARKAGDKPPQITPTPPITPAATTPPAGDNGNKPKGTPLTTRLEAAAARQKEKEKAATAKVAGSTTVLAEANLVRVEPKAFTTQSVLIWQAQEVAQREWGWPKMETGDFLDTFLYHAFEQRGITLGAYIVKEVKENDSA